ncbi:ribonuclease P protein component [Pseudobdellovibrio exovorus JSS]|uniref:Ribonuclease P protein component n=2 Tax=Pseudobdellovibrio exovorus TaxID=453816 RepID=M4VBQ6_9BACT|nr:ribonuclease P protein component [Pseudobdellovibrio exovorus JSS]
MLPSVDAKNYFGVTVSRKVANSVIRNKLKRWVRNCVSTEKWPEKYESYTFVFVFKPQADAKFFTQKKYSDFKDLYKNIK